MTYIIKLEFITYGIKRFFLNQKFSFNYMTQDHHQKAFFHNVFYNI